MRLLLAIIAAAFLVACASMGRPEGGPVDEQHPVYITSTPLPGELNYDKERIVITFDENVQVEDAQNKVIVSPPQKVTPKVSALGKRLVVTLRDSILPNTTYTLDFSDAIKDLNEGNVLDGFALDFSTGDEIDSLRISGMVLEGRTLEPAQGMLVGVYAEESDTSLTTRAFDRVTKTNQLGQFTLRNLKPGSYQLFAINDVNRDYKWDRSEDIAFLGSLITPSTQPIMVTDTMVNSMGEDSTFTHPGTLYLPNDLLLTWFNIGYKPQYLLEYKRNDRNKLTMIMNTVADSLPELTLITSPQAGKRIEDVAVVEHSHTNDTITYWLRDSLVIMTDTLMVQARYMKTDSTDNLSLVTDTLKYLFKAPKKKKKEELENDTVPRAATPLDVNFSTVQELNTGLGFKVSAPLARLDTTIFRMEIKKDTLWKKVEPPVFSLRDTVNPLDYVSPPYPWKAGETYRIMADSAAISDIYGRVNRPINAEFKVKGQDDYSSVIFTISSSLASPAYVELLTSQDKVTKVEPVNKGKATFDFVTPGTYYARLFIDADTNGVYTIGSWVDSIQPEDTYYFPKKLNLKKNWTVEQAWNLNELPVDKQKPEAIKKNKPKKKKNEETTKKEDEEDEEDEFFDDPFMRAASGRNRDNTDGINSNRRRF